MAAAAGVTLPWGRVARARGTQSRTRLPPPCALLGDPHRVLGLEPGAEPAAIKKAFRRLALRFHPDVSHAEHADERFQAIQAAYDLLLRRHDDAAPDSSAAGGWRRRPAGAEPAAAEPPAEPVTPEQQEQRWRAQLGGLQQRAAVRERRDAELRYRAAMRTHAQRGAFSGAASTDAGRERLQGQLGQLWRGGGGGGGGGPHAQPTLQRDDAAAREGHLLAAAAGSVAHADADAPQQQHGPPDDAAPRESKQSAQDLRRLLRLARVARSWREATGVEPNEDAAGGFDGE